MTIKLTDGELSIIKTAATRLFIDKGNNAISPEVYSVACTLEAFGAHLKRLGMDIAIELPKRENYQSVDED